jgi:hypothetical protein
MTGDGGQHGRLPGEDGDVLGGAQGEAERPSRPASAKRACIVATNASNQPTVQVICGAPITSAMACSRARLRAAPAGSASWMATV